MNVEGSVDTALQRAAGLAIWTGPVSPEPLGGGLTNVNFVVEDAGRRYVVRIGDDIVEHQVMRFNELAASRAAHAAGVSPRVVHHQPGVLVLDFIEAVTLDEAMVRDRAMLERIVPLVRRCHQAIPEHLRGPALMFWVFHVLNDYGAALRDGDSPHLSRLAELARAAGTPPGWSGSFAPTPTSPSCSAIRSISTSGSRPRPARPPAGR
jgi:hypothetical protein